MSSIRIVTIDQAPEIVSLAKAMSHFEEPGFQVDKVHTVADFLTLERLLHEGAPHLMPRCVFDDAYEEKTPVQHEAHVDGTLAYGFAVHHNLGSEYPVYLGIARTRWLPRETFQLSPDEVDEYRSGKTTDNRLTIMSQGRRYLRRNTRRTAHFFDRSALAGPDRGSWARFTYDVRRSWRHRDAVVDLLEKRLRSR